MTSVALRRLRVRGPPEYAARTVFRIEDACRTELPLGDRLILIRRLELGRSMTARKQAERAAAMRRAYDRATSDGRHGGNDGADAANCVWFENRAEARRLLLLALLAGRRPTGWFWRLAVPEWGGKSLEEWLGAMLAHLLSDGADGAEFLDLVVLAAEAGAAGAVIDALARTPEAAGADDPPASGAAPWARSAKARPGDPAAALAASVEVRRTLSRLRAKLRPPVVAAVERIVRRIGAHSRAASLLLERMLIRASPPLSLSRIPLESLIGAYAEWLSKPEPDLRVASHDTPPSEASSGRQNAPRDRAPPRAPASHGQRRAGTPVDETRAGQEATPAPPPRLAAQVASHEASEPIAEVASQAAGLWLVIPPLIRLGLREWLADRPALLAADPGRALLRTIANHHRVGPDDPALAPLAAGEDGFEAPDWARLWRAGLDRWLRRRARVKLARLVWRAGWIRCAEDRLVVRFPLAAADIRLRRQALDVDPGWTDWLGLSVRYAYSERPER